MSSISLSIISLETFEIIANKSLWINYAFVEPIGISLNAALRIIPIGSTKAQLIQRDLLEIISKVSKEIMDKEIDDIYFGNVGLAMAQQNHNDLYTKLFRN